MTPKNIYTIKNNFQQEMERQGLRLLEKGVQIGFSTQLPTELQKWERGKSGVCSKRQDLHHLLLGIYHNIPTRCVRKGKPVGQNLYRDY